MPGRGRPFQPGQSGNPGGRPKVIANIREIAREYAPEAVLRLVELMRDEDPRVAVAACKEILDRGFGRPQLSTDVEKDHEQGGPLEHRQDDIRVSLETKIARLAATLNRREIPQLSAPEGVPSHPAQL